MVNIQKLKKKKITAPRLTNLILQTRRSNHKLRPLKNMVLIVEFNVRTF